MVTRAASIAILLGASCVAIAQGFSEQPAELQPTVVEGGVLFRCKAPGAKVVYVAGDFNDWARNQAGLITDAAFAMDGPDGQGVWSKIVKLQTGHQRFKYCADGDPEGWFAPSNVECRDGDGNAVFRLTKDGRVVLGRMKNDALQPRVADGVVTFRLHAPEATTVHLAGDFNGWANNADGVVTSEACALTGPDAEGVWTIRVPLAKGRHLYQFVIDGRKWILDPNGRGDDGFTRSLLVIE